MQALAVVVAAIPMGRMVAVVMGGARLQHADYWLMLPTFTTGGGGLDVGGLFELHNGHPVVVAKLVYWCNIHFFAGSNIALGLFVVALAAVQVAIIAAVVARSALGRTERLLTLIVASALSFSLAGTWNFSHAMSGTAWLSANVFALAAVLFRSRDRRGWAFGFAVAASLSYGTGIAVWPAVLITGVSRHPARRPWREWSFVVGGALAYTGCVLAPGVTTHELPSPTEMLALTARMLWFVFGTDGSLAQGLGYGALAAMVVVAGLMAATARTAGVAGAVGVTTYGLAATVVIVAGRAEFVELLGLQHRYYSVQAIAWIGFFLLVILALEELVGRVGPVTSALRGRGTRFCTAVLAIGLGAGSIASGASHAEEMLGQNRDQELNEIALRLGLADRSSYLLSGVGVVGELTPVLRATGHHPFTDGWDLDCGLLGERIERVDGAPAVEGVVEEPRPAELLDDAVGVSGRVSERIEIDCLLVVGADDEVIGIATPRPDGGDVVPFAGLARRSDGYRVVVVTETRNGLLRLTQEN